MDEIDLFSFCHQMFTIGNIYSQMAYRSKFSQSIFLIEKSIFMSEID